MRIGPEGQSVGAELRVTSVKSPIVSMGKLVKQGDKFETDCVQDVDRESQCDVGHCEKKKLWVDAEAYTKDEGALDGRCKICCACGGRVTQRIIVEFRPDHTKLADSSRAS